jgi:hypothetical protein
MKKSFVLIKSTDVSNDKEISYANMPNQYARVKSVAEGEYDRDQNDASVDEFTSKKQ